MADGHDDRGPAIDMFDAQPGQLLALVIGEQELFGEVGENADPVHPLENHAIESAALSLQVKRAIIPEDGRGDWPDAMIFSHSMISNLSRCRSLISMPRPGRSSSSCSQPSTASGSPSKM